MPQTLSSRGNLENNKSAIRLHEIGPRLTIELIKVQNDLFTGEVLYHNTIVKTEEEIAELKKAREEKKRLKDLRKKIQNENVAKKEEKKGEHKKRSMVGGIKTEEINEEEYVDNDAEYYREAVGEEPDDGKRKKNELFTESSKMIYANPFICYRIIPCAKPHWRSKACFCSKANETRQGKRC